MPVLRGLLLPLQSRANGGNATAKMEGVCQEVFTLRVHVFQTTLGHFVSAAAHILAAIGLLAWLLRQSYINNRAGRPARTTSSRGLLPLPVYFRILAAWVCAALVGGCLLVFAPHLHADSANPWAESALFATSYFLFNAVGSFVYFLFLRPGAGFLDIRRALLPAGIWGLYSMGMQTCV